MEFVFKRALAPPAVSWKLDGTKLVGANASLELGEVSSCNFNYTPLKRRMSACELQLTANGSKTDLRCVGEVGAGDRDIFLSLALAIFRVLQEQNPDLKVSSTGTDVMAWGFAAIGTASALWGLYFAASHFSDNDSAFAMGVGAVMVLMGAFCIWVGSPWKSNKPKSLTEAVEWLERLRAL